MWAWGASASCFFWGVSVVPGGEGGGLEPGRGSLCGCVAADGGGDDAGDDSDDWDVTGTLFSPTEPFLRTATPSGRVRAPSV